MDEEHGVLSVQPLRLDDGGDSSVKQLIGGLAQPVRFKPKQSSKPVKTLPPVLVLRGGQPIGDGPVKALTDLPSTPIVTRPTSGTRRARTDRSVADAAPCRSIFTLCSGNPKASRSGEASGRERLGDLRREVIGRLPRIGQLVGRVADSPMGDRVGQERSPILRPRRVGMRIRVIDQLPFRVPR